METFSPCLLYLFMECLERRPWSYLQIWVDSWQQKWTNLFLTCETGLMAGSQSRLQINTTIWSSDFTSPLPCGTRIQTGTRDQASTWHNILHIRIISHAHPKTIIHLQHDPPPPLFRAPRVSSPWPQIDIIYGRIHREDIGIKVGILAYKSEIG